LLDNVMERGAVPPQVENGIPASMGGGYGPVVCQKPVRRFGAWRVDQPEHIVADVGRHELV
jgi:hypothetical protein